MRLPIKALRELANRYGYSHVIVYAYDSKNNMQHVGTWGRTVNECDQAARLGNMMKDALKWPQSLYADPNRVKRLKQRIKELELQLSRVENTTNNSYSPGEQGEDV